MLFLSQWLTDVTAANCEQQRWLCSPWLISLAFTGGGGQLAAHLVFQDDLDFHLCVSHIFPGGQNSTFSWQRRDVRMNKPREARGPGETCMCFSRHCLHHVCKQLSGQGSHMVETRVGMGRDYQVKNKECGYSQVIMQSMHFRKIPKFQLLSTMPIVHQN